MSIITGAGLESFRKIYTAGTAYAMAELVDNSIQANATEITIVLIERINSKRKLNLSEILIIDNGEGMDEEILSTCLDFGGGTKHGATTGLGRYGIGLPYASASQCPNYTVFSWQDDGPVYMNYRNHAEYDLNESVEKNMIQEADFPPYFERLFPSLNNLESGTIVQWDDCDKLDAKTSKTIVKYVDITLGRIYRHYLKKNINISFLVYREQGGDFTKLDDFCRKVRIFDPMFMAQGTCLPKPYDKQKTNSLYDKSTLRFRETKDDEEIIHTFKINFSIANDNIQELGGGSSLGKFYGNVVGISLVRSDRELKLDKFDFPFSQSEPRHRWWSCEVLFEPVSDDLLGVSANKIDASNFRYISNEDFEDHMKDFQEGDLIDTSKDPTQGIVDLGDDPVFQIRRELSKNIHLNIQEMMKIITSRQKGKTKLAKCPKCGEKKFKNGKCEACEYTSNKCPVHDIAYDKKGKCPACETIIQTKLCWKCQTKCDEDGSCPKCKVEEIILTDEERAQIRKKLETYDEFRDNEKAIEKTIEWFIKSKKKQFFIFTNLHNGMILFDHRKFQDGSFRLIEVNTKHSFYDEFMGPIIDEDDDEQVTPLLLFIATMVEAELADYSNLKIYERFRERFGYKLKNILENWLEVDGI